MTTEYGQRILIDRDMEKSVHNIGNSSFNSGADDDDDDDETDVAALLGEEERVFGFTSNKKYRNGFGATVATNGRGHFSFLPSSSTTKFSPSTASPQDIQTIRFQVIIWNIGKLDVASGSVPMTFRVSLFWDDIPAVSQQLGDSPSTRNQRRKFSRLNMTAYQMQGRQKAVPQRIDSTGVDISAATATSNNDDIDVPPLSILNVSTFTIIGSPEIDMLDADRRLIRWTCMYRATVIQDHLSVHQFPHDCHTIALELAILSHRRAGQRWDRPLWRLGLATEEDVRVSRKAMQIPHGLIVDHVHIPEFHINRPRHHLNRHLRIGGFLPPTKSRGGGSDCKHSAAGLQFQFCSQQDGSFNCRTSLCGVPDVYLRVSLIVIRDTTIETSFPCWPF
jgi:hypothetical protein